MAASPPFAGACLPLTSTLSNGVEVPRSAVGTFKVSGQTVEDVVKWALQIGYRHIDTASVYKNEAEIGAAVRASGVPRESVFITSKLSPYEHGYDAALAACQASLDRLATNYLDLYLIHWPGVARKPPTSPENAELRMETWRALERLHTEGKCRAIGVSNYCVQHLQHMLPLCSVKPMLNQVELHPLLAQKGLREMCAEEGIAVAAYAPFGSGQLLANEAVLGVSASSGRTPSQVLLNWSLQRAQVAVFKTEKRERLLENSVAANFKLSTADLSSLDELDSDHHYCWAPGKVF